MRRFVSSIVLACGVALTSACGSSGGTGFSSGSGSPSSVDHVVISTLSGAVNDFFIAPGGTGAALALKAVAQNGGGVGAVVVPNATFTWNARLIDPSSDPTSISQYTYGVAPNGVVKTCPGLPQTPTGVSATALPLYADASGTPLGASQQTTAAYFAPTVGIAPPYCVLVTATYGAGAAFGAVTVVVASNPAGPS